MRYAMGLAAFLLLAGQLFAAAPMNREEKVRADKTKIEAEGNWIYGDFAKAVAEGKETGKPILVVLRCIPCEQCVKLDDDLVNNDPHVKPLLEKFVRVRIISTNGLDLSLFQYDYDQSFAVFMLNADGTIYGRFGTRSHGTIWVDDVSVEGLAQAMEGALALHAKYPGNKAELAAKRGKPPEFASPELLPALKDKYTAKIDYEGKLVQSCIHCHQIGDAQRVLIRSRKQPLPDETIFPYPHPKAIGLILDPKQRATVIRIEKNTPAEKAGFQTGDVLLKLSGQPLLSIADVQWVLHHASPKGETLTADIERDGKPMQIKLTLEDGWRRRDEITWRVTTWGLRRMTTGGMVLESLSADDRQAAGLADSDGGVRVKFVGQNGPHSAAKNAGVKAGDVILSFDGHTDFRRETDLIAYALQHRSIGDNVPMTILRGKEKIEVKIPMQE